MKASANLVDRSAALWGMYYKSLYVGPKPADFGRYVVPGSGHYVQVEMPEATAAAVLDFLARV